MSLPGGGLAVGGGGLGLVGLAIYLLIALLSNGGGGLSAPLQNLDSRPSQSARRRRRSAAECRPAPTRTRARTAASSAT